MALLIKAEEMKGLISVREAIAAVREGFRDQGEKPAYSAPRIRIQHEDRRVSVHPGGCHRLQIAGTFIHVERFTFHGGAQQYEKAGKRVYVAYDSETAELKTIIVGSLPLFDRAGGGLVRHRDADHRRGRHRHSGAAGLPGARPLRHRPAGAPASRRDVHDPAVDRGGASVQPQRREPRSLRVAHAAAGARASSRPSTRPEEVARGADLICLATGSNVPVLFGDWLEPGQHVTSIVASNKGVFAAGFGLAPAARIRRRGDRARRSYRCDAQGAGDHGRAGGSVRAGERRASRPGTRSPISANSSPARRTGRAILDEITVFKQNSDQGVGFMALAKPRA